ncbi:DUF1015 domain-containing protein [bacterium]|nr:DUF1015 domain-containing protein [bacterium]
MEVLPLNAVVYNQDKVEMKDVVAPPYDVIDDKYQDELYSRSEFNCVRLILTKGENRYSDAEKYFKTWLEDNILIKTDKPAIFYIVQKYKNEKGKLIERKGFIARNKIEDFESKKILPHEFTMGGPKEDRFKLVSATGAFYSQIFMVYEDKAQRIENEVAAKYLAAKPYMDITDDLGIQNLVYLIDDERDIAIISEVLADKTLLIADGHHRYETSMRFAKENPQNEYAQYVMSYFTNAADENLVIYPTHRIIEKDFQKDELLQAVKKYYDVLEMTDKEAFLEKIEEENKKQITTGLILKDDEKYYVLKLKEGVKETIPTAKELQKLDLTVLHELILKKELGFSQEELMAQNGVKYEKKENVSFESVKTGKASACFIMAYPKMQDIIQISSAGLRMPQKSTYFYPKLLSGIVINPLR